MLSMRAVTVFVPRLLGLEAGASATAGVLGGPTRLRVLSRSRVSMESDLWDDLLTTSAKKKPAPARPSSAKPPFRPPNSRSSQPPLPTAPSSSRPGLLLDEDARKDAFSSPSSPADEGLFELLLPSTRPPPLSRQPTPRPQSAARPAASNNHQRQPYGGKQQQSHGGKPQQSYGGRLAPKKPPATGGAAKKPQRPRTDADFYIDPKMMMKDDDDVDVDGDGDRDLRRRREDEDDEGEGGESGGEADEQPQEARDRRRRQRQRVENAEVELTSRITDASKLTDPEDLAGPRQDEEITAAQVLLIGLDGKRLGTYSVASAIAMARSKDRRLVVLEVNRKAVPPICRIVDPRQLEAQERQRQMEERRRIEQSTTGKRLKELRFGSKIAERDVQLKVRQLRAFLLKGHSVKTTVIFHSEGVDLQLANDYIDHILARVAPIANRGDFGQTIDRKLKAVSVIFTPKPNVVESEKLELQLRELNGEDDDYIF